MNVTGLLPNTRYRFTVRAETVFGDIRAVGDESAQESVITNMTGTERKKRSCILAVFW